MTERTGKRREDSRCLWLRIGAVVAIHAADITWAAWYMYRLRDRGALIGVSRAAEQPLTLLGQNLAESLVPALLFVLTLLLLKKEFPEAMYLRLRGKWQRVTALVLLALLAGLMAGALTRGVKPYTALYALGYYLVIIAFSEEFITRGLCAYLLREEDWPLRFLVPNICFALLHLFSYADWGAITPDYVLRFLTTAVLGLTVHGCLLQLLKEKSGTIWLSVLLHAAMDYSIVLKF